MKKYFDFTLTGKQFLPVWIIFFLIVFIPYGLCFNSLKNMSQTGTVDPMIGWVFLLIMLGAFFISFYIIKITIENVKYKENTIRFEGNFLIYFGKILLGCLLTFVTLTIYMAWFIKDITKFFVNKSSIDSNNFQFMGKGGQLFLILLLTLYLPFIVLAMLLGKNITIIYENIFYQLIYQAIIFVIIIPYAYYGYKWMIDIKYKNYRIKWDTDFYDSFKVIFVQFLLSLITLGIYSPLAFLRLYKYFSERTIATDENTDLKFGYEIDPLNDFKFIWGQLLLTIITLGIYYPWAYCKIGQRILKKTYIENKNAA